MAVRSNLFEYVHSLLETEAARVTQYLVTQYYCLQSSTVINKQSVSCKRHISI